MDGKIIISDGKIEGGRKNTEVVENKERNLTFQQQQTNKQYTKHSKQAI